MRSTAIAEWSVARLLVTVEQLLVGVPAFAAIVVALEGAKFLSARLIAAAKITLGFALMGASSRVAAPLTQSGVTAAAKTTASATTSVDLATRSGLKGAPTAIAALHSFTLIVILPTLRSDLVSRLGHSLPASSFTQFAEKTLVRLVNTTPLHALKPSLQRYLNLHSLLESSLDDYAVDRSPSISCLCDLADKSLSKSAVSALQRLIAIFLHSDGLQLHRKVSGLGGAQDTFNA
jgi:hypothetical protein